MTELLFFYIYIDTSDSHIPYESNMHDFILCSHCILNCALFRANYLVFFFLLMTQL